MITTTVAQRDLGQRGREAAAEMAMRTRRMMSTTMRIRRMRRRKTQLTET
jgi:hypothetical protein